MPLFTMIADHRGGNYVMQVRAETVGAAFVEWCARVRAETLMSRSSPHAARAVERRLRSPFDDRPFSELPDLEGVWRMIVSLGDSTLLICCVETRSSK